MERHFEIMIELMVEQLAIQKQILTRLKDIEESMPSEVNISKIERLLTSIGDSVVNLER